MAKRVTGFAGALTLCALGIGAAHAQEGEAISAWTAEGTVGAVSDYRYRGFSLSDNDVAWQADVTLAHASGFYLYGWVSSVTNDGDEVELMGTLGYAADLNETGLSIDVAANVFTYPGVDESTSVEFAATLTQMVGDVSLSAGIGYFPEQDALWDMDNTYIHAGVGAPLPFWGAEGSLTVGWEDGAYGDEKIDWTAAVDVPLWRFNLRLAYVGTDDDVYGDLTDDGFVGELRYAWSFGG
ncbi:MAG: TorF family putative porin [Hyphomonadaceae bacterium]